MRVNKQLLKPRPVSEIVWKCLHSSCLQGLRRCNIDPYFFEVLAFGWQKNFESLIVVGTLSVFINTLLKWACSFVASYRHKVRRVSHKALLSTFQTESWISWAAAIPRRQEKSWRDELVAPWQQCHLCPPPVTSLRATWWSSCHRHLSVMHFLCPIPEVASAKIYWKITLGW